MPCLLHSMKCSNFLFSFLAFSTIQTLVSTSPISKFKETLNQSSSRETQVKFEKVAMPDCFISGIPVHFLARIVLLAITTVSGV